RPITASSLVFFISARTALQRRSRSAREKVGIIGFSIKVVSSFWKFFPAGLIPDSALETRKANSKLILRVSPRRNSKCLCRSSRGFPECAATSPHPAAGPVLRAVRRDLEIVVVGVEEVDAALAGRAQAVLGAVV